uniref:Prolyl 4-hydroxylase alpha subunit Fe(2+) 2OG dioxygenase domain-containing protein n=1 Tax=Diacronema lutheri TaxID=2081491 RepID=A0A7R9UXG5_DIALT|mmetsp:Transcript_8096/g.25580  ORF Transcript_8096/g.25580 Transcript_8096/m.25580 type:complete len:290 (+) Transcript_8096:2-871(+)
MAQQLAESVVANGSVADDVLGRILGQANRYVRRETLGGLAIQLTLVPFSEATIGHLCELALSHECDALEKQMCADDADDGRAEEGHGDGRACGASFCGFYHTRDILAWAQQAEPSEASRSVLEARRAIEAALEDAGVRLREEPTVRCEAWLNVLRHGDFLRLHDHAGALASGVCWLDAPAAANGEEAAQRAHPWWSGAFLAACEPKGGEIEYCVVRARERWCALFPGALHHAVLPFYAPARAGDAGACGPLQELLGEDWGRVRVSLSFNFFAPAMSPVQKTDMSARWAV